MYSVKRSASPSMIRGVRKTPADVSMINSTTTVNIQPHHFLRSRSLSPGEPCHRTPKAYAVVGATQCGVVIGPMSSKPSFHSHRSASDTPPTRYTSPFISTKSRPSLYQRAISDSPPVSGRGRSRSRSAANSPVTSSPVLPAPSYAGSMIPPYAPHHGSERYQRQNDDQDSRRDSESSRCSSRASTAGSITISNPSGKKGFVAKLKSVLKGGGDSAEANIIYLTPEEAREREIKIKKAFHGHPIATGGLGV